MAKLSHYARVLSTIAGAVGLIGAAGAASTPQGVYVARWTVSDDKPVYSSRGLQYQTVDIVPCGKDHCGISVAKNGACGPTLFRFRVKPIDSEDGLFGRGRWGNQTKNIEIYADWDKDSKGGRFMHLYLGDGHDFGERSGNMPKFSAGYSPVGKARCSAR